MDHVINKSRLATMPQNSENQRSYQRTARSSTLALMLMCTFLSQAIDVSAQAPGQKGVGSALRLTKILTKDNIVHSPVAHIKAQETTRDWVTTSIGFEATSSLRLKSLKRYIRKRADGVGRALFYSGGGGHRIAIVLPAKPATRYRLSRSVRTTNSRIDLRLVETRVKLRHPRIFNHQEDRRRVLPGKFVRMKDLLYVHRWPSVTKLNAWQKSSLEFTTSLSAGSFMLLIDHAESVVYRHDIAFWLDDIIVEELPSSRQSMMTSIRNENLRQMNGAGLGLVTHGQLLPAGDASLVPQAQERNFDYRSALFVPTPTRLKFTVSIHPETRFNFSYGLHKASKQSDVAKFKVFIKTPEREEILFEDRLSLQNPQSWRWHDASIDLDAWQGQKVELWLETTSDQPGPALALWGSPIIERVRHKDGPPNVLFIAIDTLRADRLSSYGHSRNTTPHIDSVARDGIRFDQAISSSNWTTSAFASMFTAMPPSRHGVIHRARALSPKLRTLPEYFADAGWKTHAIMYKAYLYNMGFEQGFDTWFNMPRANNTADDNLALATQWLLKNKKQRFFLFFHLNDPHQPFNHPEPFASLYQKPVSEFSYKLPITIGTRNQVLGCSNCAHQGRVKPAFKTVAKALYDSALNFTDDRVGRLLNVLKQQGLYDDTIIVIVSDHGEVMWDRMNYFGHGGPLMTEELIRVPLIIKPHRTYASKAGRVVKEPVTTASIMPTLLDMVNLKLEPNQGIKSLSLLASGNPERDKAEWIVSENLKQQVLSLRQGKWKYTVRHKSSSAYEEWLNDLESDPKERTNVASRFPKKMYEARQEAISHWVNNRPGHYILAKGIPSPGATVFINGLTSRRKLKILFGGAPHRSGPGRLSLRFPKQRHESTYVLAEVSSEIAQDIELELRENNRIEKLHSFKSLSWENPLNLRAQSSKNFEVMLLHNKDTEPSYVRRNTLKGDQIATLKSLGYMD
jgi:choline-sulfatase